MSNRVFVQCQIDFNCYKKSIQQIWELANTIFRVIICFLCDPFLILHILSSSFIKFVYCVGITLVTLQQSGPTSDSEYEPEALKRLSADIYTRKGILWNYTVQQQSFYLKRGKRSLWIWAIIPEELGHCRCFLTMHKNLQRWGAR